MMNQRNRVRARCPAVRGCALGAAVVLAIASGVIPPAAAQSGGRLYHPSMADCGGFTVLDAAEILGLAAPKITSATKELYAGVWQCTFESGIPGKGIVFSVTAAKSVAVAVADLEKLRANLEVAGNTAPFKDKLPRGAYSDISGVGDDAVWTDVNTTLSVRKGNVTLVVMMPGDKMAQINVAERFLSKLK
jgi:hypothetical protein